MLQAHPIITRGKQVFEGGGPASNTCFPLVISALPQAKRKKGKTSTCKGVWHLQVEISSNNSFYDALLRGPDVDKKRK